ncbi:hypothetical protein EYF80_036528 [Liparis tanakae]|uniref:Uncharacterized protein n=1 Tax=Liparis tanakae TaxID=230148 RepID=A0A4Z2GIA3_9TELE|nr:hypothetical protein EYF80_036528 [Liparis tanakae]
MGSGRQCGRHELNDGVLAEVKEIERRERKPPRTISGPRRAGGEGAKRGNGGKLEKRRDWREVRSGGQERRSAAAIQASRPLSPIYYDCKRNKISDNSAARRFCERIRGNRSPPLGEKGFGNLCHAGARQTASAVDAM